MAKFKIGDRVRVVQVNGDCGCWIDRFVGKEGVVTDNDESPTVRFDCGETDWGSEDYLELVRQDEFKSGCAELSLTITHITIGGKRFRLVPED